VAELDPGPLPAIVEPEVPTEHVLILNVALGWQLAVCADWRGTGLTGIALRAPGLEMESPLTPDQVDTLCQMLARCCPLDPVPGQEDTDMSTVHVEARHVMLMAQRYAEAWAARLVAGMADDRRGIDPAGPVSARYRRAARTHDRRRESLWRLVRALERQGGEHR
jgi:hypothetical protein